jgi:hypothetical protein
MPYETWTCQPNPALPKYAAQFMLWKVFWRLLHDTDKPTLD